MSIASGIKSMYPQAEFVKDFLVVDYGEGKGPVVNRWNAEKLGPMPSLKNLEAAGVLVRDAARASRADRASLRQQVQDETEAAWLARTDAQRWKIVLRILKAIGQRI